MEHTLPPSVYIHVAHAMHMTKPKNAERVGARRDYNIRLNLDTTTNILNFGKTRYKCTSYNKGTKFWEHNKSSTGQPPYPKKYNIIYMLAVLVLKSIK